MGGWVDQGGHVAGCVCMVAVQWLQKDDKKSGQVLAGQRNWLGDGHAVYHLPRYLAMYGHFANFGGT